MVYLSQLLTWCLIVTCVGLAGIAALLRKRIGLGKGLLAIALVGGALIGGLELRAASVRGECEVVRDTLGLRRADPGDAMGTIPEVHERAATMRAEVAAWRARGAGRSSPVAKAATGFADALERRATLLERAGTPDEEALIDEQKKRAEEARPPKAERDRPLREAVDTMMKDEFPEAHFSSASHEDLETNMREVNEPRGDLLTSCFRARFDWH